MAQSYSTDGDIFRSAEVIGPIEGWPSKMSLFQSIADAVHPQGFTTWVALWPDGTVCTLAVPVDHERPRIEQIVRGYRGYHSHRHDVAGSPVEQCNVPASEEAA